MVNVLAKKGIATEINTGAISRGYMKKPYPSDYFLSLLRERGVPIAINSDSHASHQLDGSFELALACAKKAGYTEIIYDIDRTGYKFCALDK